MDEKPPILIQICQSKPRNCSEKQKCLLKCIKLCKYLNQSKIDLPTEMGDIRRFGLSASSDEGAEIAGSSLLKMKPLSDLCLDLEA